MKTYIKEDFHNPEQLTRQQVGEEYRLLLLEEVDGRFSKSRGGSGECYPLGGDAWKNRECWDRRYTFRVPLATPLPDGTVLSSNECCFSDVKPSVTVDAGSASEVEQAAARIAKLLDERADCLAEVMLYRGENGDWTVEAGNPNACVMLGEVPGVIRAEGLCLLEALSNAENALTEREEKPRKKRVYVAGPMSNMPDYNFPAFYAAAESLEKQGYDPVNPAQLDIEAGYTLERIKELDPAEFQEFLKGAAKRDLDALQQCDAIALLPGWENSKGARAEKAVAEWLGLEVMYLDGAECSRDGAGVFGNLGPCSACIGYDGAEGESGPVDTLSEKAPQISDAKQPYNSDERAEWDVSSLMSKLQSSIAPDDPKGAAGAKKAPMWLLPPYALQQTAWVHKHGAVKYLPYNWRGTGVCATTYISAIMRHLDAWRDGEDNDPESGISHIAHVAASCNILLDAQHCGKLNDDRAKLCQI